MYKIFLVIFVIIFLLLAIFLPHLYFTHSINKTITHMGGKLIDTHYHFTTIGTPFVIHPKGSYIYKVDYEINGMKKTAWVRINLFTSKWVW